MLTVPQGNVVGHYAQQVDHVHALPDEVPLEGGGDEPVGEGKVNDLGDAVLRIQWEKVEENWGNNRTMIYCINLYVWKLPDDMCTCEFHDMCPCYLMTCVYV